MISSFRAFPNPFKPKTEIQFDLQNPENAVVNILTLEGRVVRELLNAHLSSGTHRVSWEGTDNEGNNVSSGIYLYQIKTAKVNHRAIITLFR